jgi:hypothetical protein
MIMFQCFPRNSFHVVLRPDSGAGSIAARSSMAALVPRPDVMFEISKRTLDELIPPGAISLPRRSPKTGH